MEDKELKKELDKIPDVDKNGDPIYKIDDSSEKAENDSPTIEDETDPGDESEFKDTLQDLKDVTSQD